MMAAGAASLATKSDIIKKQSALRREAKDLKKEKETRLERLLKG